MCKSTKKNVFTKIIKPIITTIYEKISKFAFKK